ncbi:MAG: hypothetical protein RI556_11980 [Hydrogenovibrio sp.]|uniref:lysophospholipid acyltransferase family protein n=1 Tax=Hydrogenovibrio sp. TaxID=2065821 RepID=UPI0028703D02|nr:hypothetical protein [Hydrogenovibrio sp.]MDR9499886.1 hypothetical protein [Hydrogenovibrio sp.]
MFDHHSFKHKFILPALAKMPAGIGYHLVRFIGRWYFQFYEKNWVRDYHNGLKEVFKEVEPKVIRKWVKSHLSMMAMEELDVYSLKTMNERNFMEWVDFDLPQDFLAPQGDAGSGASGKIIVTGHAGRTILLSALGLAGFPCGVFTMGVKGNPNLSAWQQAYLSFKMHTAMEKMGGHWLTDQDNYRKIFRTLKEGESLVIAADVGATKKEKSSFYPFLGGKVSVSNGIARLAEKTGADLYYAQILQDENDYKVRIRIRPLDEAPEMALEEAFQLLERDIRRAPWLWWQWNGLRSIWSPLD